MFTPQQQVYLHNLPLEVTADLLTRALTDYGLIRLHYCNTSLAVCYFLPASNILVQGTSCYCQFADPDGAARAVDDINNGGVLYEYKVAGTSHGPCMPPYRSTRVEDATMYECNGMSFICIPMDAARAAD